MHLTPLAMAVLKLLHERPAHPYELQQEIHNRRLDHFIKVRAGSLYHTIERLHREALIEPVETGRAGRRPERTVYAITDEGLEQFRDRLRTMLRDPVAEYPIFGAAVEMLRTLAPTEVVALLGRRLVALEASIASYDRVLWGLTGQGLARVNLIEVEYALAVQRAEAEWITALVADLRSGALSWPAPQHDGAGADDPATAPTHSTDSTDSTDEVAGDGPAGGRRR